jgi:hypothetical protein
MDPITPVPQTPAPASQAPQPTAPVTAPFDGPVALFKFGWNIFTKHWKALAPIILFPFVLYAVGALLFTTGSSVGAILGFIVVIASYVFFAAAVPATIQAIHKLTVDPMTPVSFKAQYRFGFSVFWPLILIVLIGGLINMGSSMLFFIPGIIVGVFTCVHLFTFVIDGKRNFGAFTESFSLVRGRWWGVFGRLLFMIILLAVIYLIFLGIAYLVHLLPNVLAIIIGILVGIVFFTFVWSFVYGYLYRLYASLKATRAPESSTSTFKGWLIAFLCVGVLFPFVLAALGIFSSIALVSLNAARMKGLEAQKNATSAMAEIQRQIDAENLDAMQSNQTGVPARY